MHDVIVESVGEGKGLRASEVATLGWKDIDAGLRRLARREAAHAYEVGQFLLAARRNAVHARLGYATHAEYIERVLGYEPRTTEERLRVAEALESLPRMSAAVQAGAIHWSAARELTRVATAETEAEWLALGEGRTIREVEQAVAGRRRGDRPEDVADPSLRRHVVRLELSPEALALYRETVGRLRRDVDGRLSEEDALMEMCRRALGGPGDEGRSPFQIAVTVCEGCGRTWQDGRGELVEVDAEVGERAACDGQRIGAVGLRGERDAGGPHVGALEMERNGDPHVGALEMERDGDPHVGAGPRVGASKGWAGPRARATQTIPPRIRREVVRRDHGRCRVPGCRNTAWVEVHHVTTREEFGTHDPDGLLLLCGAHHRLLHRGFLIIEGTSPAFVFRHADGTAYERLPSPAGVQEGADAFSALRNLGLGDGEAKRAIAMARTHVGDGARLEELIRAALRAHRASRSGEGEARGRIDAAGEAEGGSGGMGRRGGEGRLYSLLPPRVDEVREEAPAYGVRRSGGFGHAA